MAFSDTFESTLLPEEIADVVIFGSSAIALHAVDLGRAPKDLDVFVSDQLFAKLATRYDVGAKPAKEGGSVPFIAPIKGVPIEILKSFLGVSFDEVLTRGMEVPSSVGFKVGALDDLRTWKVSQGSAKDREDLKRIDAFLAERALPWWQKLAKHVVAQMKCSEGR